MRGSYEDDKMTEAHTLTHKMKEMNKSETKLNQIKLKNERKKIIFYCYI